jgi:uncharacterized protein
MMWWSGFLLGFAGSLHCAGMCGPLLLATKGTSAYGTWVHHLGRLLSYVMLGVFATGLVFMVPGRWAQTTLSILLGIGLLIFAFFQWRTPRWSVSYAPWRWAMGKILKLPGTSRSLLAGLAHGLLPCGLSYAAAFAAGGTTAPVGYMVLFGLGTLPALLGFQWALAPWLAHRKQWTIAVMVGTGIWLVVRGYLALQAPEVMTGHCA